MVGTGRAAKMGILIKNGEVLERVNDIDTVVFDKTGTITVGKPAVTDIIGDADQVLRVAASLEAASEHPLAAAITARATKDKRDIPVAADFKAVEGKGVQATVDGKQAFVGNTKLLQDYQISADLQSKMVELQNEAKTVVLVGRAGAVIGLIAIQDAPKSTSKEAIASLHARGLKTVMLTGDNERVARAIADQVGIDDVVADVLPGDKADHIKQLQETNKVAFVGDGINDAPALTQATLGLRWVPGPISPLNQGALCW